MFLIPPNVKIDDVMKGLGQSESKGLPPANPVYIELAKQFTKAVGNATPGQHEEKKGEPPYRAPHNIWHGI